MEAIGTVTLPLILFSLSEGYIHTRNMYKYFLCLVIGMFVSEIPYRMLFPPPPELGFSFMNIMATLALTLAFIFILDKINKSLVLVAAIFILMIFLSNILQVDYGFYPIMLAYAFFCFRENNLAKLVLCYLVYITRYQHFILGGIIILILRLYNGKHLNNADISLKRKKAYKYAFYIFYPLHFLVLYAIK